MMAQHGSTLNLYRLNLRPTDASTTHGAGPAVDAFDCQHGRKLVACFVRGIAFEETTEI